VSFEHVLPSKAAKAVRKLALSIVLLHLFCADALAGDAEPTSDTPSAQPTAPAPHVAFSGQAVAVNHVAPAELNKVLQPLGTSGGAVLEQPGGKSLMIVDTPENTRRLLEIKELIDIPAFAATRFDSYEAKSAAAEELSAAINELVRNGVIPTEPPQSVALAPLPVGNRVLVVSKTESALNVVRRWLERLDRRTGSPRRIYIYPLGTSDGAAMEKTLAAWTAAKKGNPSNPGGRPAIKVDTPTNSVILYATAEEFQEIKDIVNPSGRMAEFKQRLASIEKIFGPEANTSKSAP